MAVPDDRSPFDIAQILEPQAIASTLDTIQWTLHGRRNRMFVLVAGSGSVHLEEEDTALRAPALVWMPTGYPARVTLRAGSRGAWMTISNAALGQVTLPDNIADDLRRIAVHPQPGSAVSRSTAERLTALISGMEAELREGHPGAQEMVRHQLSIVLILLWRSSDLLPNAPQPVPRTVVSNFLHLVDQQMRNHWGVSDYARALRVSTDRLNSAVQRATGQPPLAIIHARLLNEARQMIESSGLQISQIAASLGFEDPAYFSRFFKRLSGKSPRQYRADFIKNQLKRPGSFAAWP